MSIETHLPKKTVLKTLQNTFNDMILCQHVKVDWSVETLLLVCFQTNGGRQQL